MTKEIIEKRIAALEAERDALHTSHDRMIREHQQRTEMIQQNAQQNANRMQQLYGAIAEFRRLVNGNEPPTKKNTPP